LFVFFMSLVFKPLKNRQKAYQPKALYGRAPGQNMSIKAKPFQFC
jgi:hypothetical protein